MNRIILILNYIFIACLFTSYLAPFVSPENFPIIALFGIAYPIWVGINFIFVIFWLILWRKKFLLSLIAILAGLNMLTNYWSFNTKASVLPGQNKIKILSYNVRVFDFYTWGHKGVGNRIKMIDLIKNESADVICLQEFYTINHPKYNFKTLDTLMQLLKPMYFNFDTVLNGTWNQTFGDITISRFPIVGKGKIDFTTDGINSCMYTDIKKGNDTIRVYNMHLQSVHLVGGKYNFLENIDNHTVDNGMANSKNIIHNLYKAFQMRASQANQIAESISNCKYSVIVCGDLNDTPSSYAYRKIKGRMEDAFTESGIGFGATYAGNIPFLRIDYILHSSTLTAEDFNIIPEKLSDHYALSCTINY